MQNKKMYFVYVDFTDGNVPFYVGKGNSARVADMKRNKKHTGIAKTYGHNRKIVFETHNQDIAYTKEVDIIADLKTYVRDNPDNHFACNFCRGGIGGHGRIVSQEERERARIAKLGNTHGQVNKGKLRPKIGERQKGIAFTEERRKNISRSKTSRQKQLLIANRVVVFERLRNGETPTVVAKEFNVTKSQFSHAILKPLNALYAHLPREQDKRGKYIPRYLKR